MAKMAQLKERHVLDVTIKCSNKAYVPYLEKS